LPVTNRSEQDPPTASITIPPVIPYRTIIGITGHRRLSDLNALRDKLKEVLEREIYKIYDQETSKQLRKLQHTPLAISLITPLGEGADRLVAHEILKHPQATLEVVLPLTKEDYCQDFQSQSSNEEFELLFAQARKPICLRVTPIADQFNPEDQPEARRVAYKEVGHYVVDHCDILLALWDGKSAKGKGGVAEIVAYARDQEQPLIIISTSDHQVHLENMGRLQAPALAGLERWNQAVGSQRISQDYIRNIYSDLFKNKEAERITPSAKESVKTHLIPGYALASSQAKSHQKLYRWAGFLTYTFSALAVTGVGVALVLGKFFKWAFLLEFVLLLAIFSLVFLGSKIRAHKNWIESRFLVERIRSAIFFLISGLEVTSKRLWDDPLHSDKQDDWMTRTFQETWNHFPLQNGAETDQWNGLKEYNLKHWLNAQLEFHQNTYSKSKKINMLFERGILVLFLLAIAAAVYHLLHYFFHLDWHLGFFDKVLYSFAILLPAMAAALEGIRSQREYARIENRSKKMVKALAKIIRNFKSAEDDSSFEKGMYQAEQLMLWETTDWMMLVRGQDLKIIV